MLFWLRIHMFCIGNVEMLEQFSQATFSCCCCRWWIRRCFHEMLRLTSDSCYNSDGLVEKIILFLCDLILWSPVHSLLTSDKISAYSSQIGQGNFYCLTRTAPNWLRAPTMPCPVGSEFPWGYFLRVFFFSLSTFFELLSTVLQASSCP